MFDKSKALKQLNSIENSYFDNKDEILCFGKDYSRDNQFFLLTNNAFYLTATAKIETKNLNTKSWGFSLESSNNNILDCWIEFDVHDAHFFDNSLGCNCSNCDKNEIKKIISNDEYQDFKNFKKFRDLNNWSNLRQKAIKKIYFSTNKELVDEIFINIFPNQYKRPT